MIIALYKFSDQIHGLLSSTRDIHTSSYLRSASSAAAVDSLTILSRVVNRSSSRFCRFSRALRPLQKPNIQRLVLRNVTQSTHPRFYMSEKICLESGLCNMLHLSDRPNYFLPLFVLIK